MEGFLDDWNTAEKESGSSDRPSDRSPDNFGMCRTDHPDQGEQFATFYNMLLRAEDAEERETVKRKTADWKKYLELHRIKTARELDCDRNEFKQQQGLNKELSYRVLKT